MLALRAVEPGDIGELQALREPPPDVLRIVKAVLLLLGQDLPRYMCIYVYISTLYVYVYIYIYIYITWWFCGC
jgi:hypothetical protein